MLSRKLKIGATALMVVAVGSKIASAHPGHGAYGLPGGFTHPFTGIDHLLAMVAVGLWAVQLGGRAIYLLPLSFVSVMMLGGVSARIGLNFGDADAYITASLLILGLLVTSSAKLPLFAGTGLVGLFAFFHGYAHVREGVIEQGHAMPGFVAGFVVATVILHAVGIAIGLSLKQSAGFALARLMGTGIAICSVFIAMGWIQT